MSLQDRDYQASLKKTAPTEQLHHCLPKRAANNSSGIKYLIYPVIVLLVLWFGANQLLDKINIIKSRPHQIPQTQQPLAQQPSIELVPGGIILQADEYGQFRGTALLNNIAVPFLIDTGASVTVIPTTMATAAGLPFGMPIQVDTAGGQITQHLTKIESLKLGNAELKNIVASINQHLDFVLIGMTTLKHFRISQNANTLSLIAVNNTDEIDEVEKSLPLALAPPANPKFTSTMPTELETEQQPEIKAKTNWKKQQVCDTQNKCRIVYAQ